MPVEFGLRRNLHFTMTVTIPLARVGVWVFRALPGEVWRWRRHFQIGSMGMNGDPLLVNKLVGSVIFAGLIAMVAGFIANMTYGPQMPETMAYKIGGNAPVQIASKAAASAGPEDITGMLASADAVAGEKLFKKCAAGHTYKKGGPAKQGPNLWNVVGGDRGAAAGFKYSRDMKAIGGKWTISDLNTFLYKPKMLVKKTKMNFAGFKKNKDRANIIVFLHSKADTPMPLPN